MLLLLCFDRLGCTIKRSLFLFVSTHGGLPPHDNITIVIINNNIFTIQYRTPVRWIVIHNTIMIMCIRRKPILINTYTAASTANILWYDHVRCAYGIYGLSVGIGHKRFLTVQFIKQLVYGFMRFKIGFS